MRLAETKNFDALSALQTPPGEEVNSRECPPQAQCWLPRVTIPECLIDKSRNKYLQSDPT